MCKEELDRFCAYNELWEDERGELQLWGQCLVGARSNEFTFLPAAARQFHSVAAYWENALTEEEARRGIAGAMAALTTVQPTQATVEVPSGSVPQIIGPPLWAMGPCDWSLG